MRRPTGPNGEPRFKSDAQLSRWLGFKQPSAISHFLRTDRRGVSWAILDKLADVFELDVWELFYTPDAAWRNQRPPPAE